MYELNILSYAIENKLGLLYTTHIINYHCHHKYFNIVCKSTVNLAFLIIQPKRKIIQKIQQSTNIGGKSKAARQLQTKQWLIMINQLPEDKE